jgi:hypothetical protein
MITAREAASMATRSPIEQVTRLIREASSRGEWTIRISFNSQYPTGVHGVVGRPGDVIPALKKAGFSVVVQSSYCSVRWDHPMD